jgi:hypothetical protein
MTVSAIGLITVGLLLGKPPLWIDGLVTLCAWVGLWKTYWPNVHRGRRDEQETP